MITVSKSHTHWNYFLALESDLELVARYIEFSKQNFRTYSIELAHLLLASASEIDVIMKQLCAYLAPRKKPKNINEYKEIIKAQNPKFIKEPVYIPRYGLSFNPWTNWRYKDNRSPIWWWSYNKVKHERNLYFDKANLKNALNSMAALLIVNYYYYYAKLSEEMDFPGATISVMSKLQPESKLFRLDERHYWFPDVSK